jgi:hypothetical protein
MLKSDAWIERRRSATTSHHTDELTLASLARWRRTSIASSGCTDEKAGTPAWESHKDRLKLSGRAHTL